MAKRRVRPERIRKLYTFTLNTEIVEASRRIGEAKFPPWPLSRVVDEAMADWNIRHGPKGKGAK
jgi:hypothetical protein